MDPTWSQFYMAEALLNLLKGFEVLHRLINFTLPINKSILIYKMIKIN